MTRSPQGLAATSRRAAVAAPVLGLAIALPAHYVFRLKVPTVTSIRAPARVRNSGFTGTLQSDPQVSDPARGLPVCIHFEGNR